MAAKLVKYYELIQGLGGTKAKMRMAMATGVGSIIAAEAPDSPENLAKFRKAYKDIAGQEPPI
jgi:hypothetical protein